MATSRVHTPDAIHSLPELIPAAGNWTRNEHSYPTSKGTEWYAVEGGFTDRRKHKVQDSLVDEKQGKAGTLSVNTGSFKYRALTSGKANPYLSTVKQFKKNEMDQDWLKQKRDSRPLRGNGTWSAPLLAYQGSSRAIKGGMGALTCPRTEEIERVCDSTGIPGISWGQLLAREKRIDRLGLPADEVTNGKVVLKSTDLRIMREVANRELSVEKKRFNSLEKVHPLGREASFHDGLRSMRRRRPQQPEEWDSSPTVDRPSEERNVFQQQMYRTKIDLRNGQPKAKMRGMRTAAEKIIEEIEEEDRVRDEYLKFYAGQQRLLVTGGSWDLSRQLSVSAHIHPPPVPHKGLGNGSSEPGSKDAEPDAKNASETKKEAKAKPKKGAK